MKEDLPLNYGSSPERKSESRKKRKTVELSDQRSKTGKYGVKFQKNDYVKRSSLLETNADSYISKSPFRGIIRLVLIVLIIYILNHMLRFGRIEELNAFSLYKKDVLKVLIEWTLIIIYMHLSFAV